MKHRYYDSTDNEVFANAAQVEDYQKSWNAHKNTIHSVFEFTPTELGILKDALCIVIADGRFAELTTQAQKLLDQLRGHHL